MGSASATPPRRAATSSSAGAPKAASGSWSALRRSSSLLVPPSVHRLPKSARLLKRAEFLAVKEQGRGFAEAPLAARWKAREQAPTRPAVAGLQPAMPRAGLAVSSSVGGALERNRRNRHARESVGVGPRALPTGV